LTEIAFKTQLPDCFARICKVHLKNTRVSFGQIIDIIQSDSFFKAYTSEIFKDYLKKGGTLGMLTALGWEGFRNRLAEAILRKEAEGIYPKKIELDLVEDVLDIEKRFQFLSPVNSSRVFLFGMYLKHRDLALETLTSEKTHSIIIPETVDEILAAGSSKGDYPDWLIWSVWNLHEFFDEEKLKNLFKLHQGDLQLLLQELDTTEQNLFMAKMLDYAHAIHDSEFITTKKV
tara:strand:- start:17924 stop:18616 length:693 start_codon:yes stop_codon:yes gene_type:complete